MGTHVGVQRCAQPNSETGNAGELGYGTTKSTSHKDGGKYGKSVANDTNPPGRVDLRTRLAQSGKRTAAEIKRVASGLESAIEVLKRLIQFSEQHRNTHKEIKEGLPLVMRHLRSHVTSSEGGTKTTSETHDAARRQPVETTEAATNTEALRVESPPNRAPTPPPEDSSKSDSGTTKSKKKKKRKKNKGHAALQTASSPPPAIAEPNSAEAPKWSTIVKRGKPKPAAQKPAQVSKTRMAAVAEAKRRIPKTAAVTVRLPPGSATTLASVMRQITTKVDLKDMGIHVLDARASQAGGVTLVVRKEEEAILLAERVKTAVGADASVNRPVLTIPVLLLNVPEWITPEDIQVALRDADVVGKAATPPTVTASSNGGARSGCKTARFRVPAAAAVKIGEAGWLQIGWSRCRVKLLSGGQGTCFRCQERGHYAATCKAPAKEKRCYRCQKEGHLARDCGLMPSNRTKEKTSAPEEKKEEEEEEVREVVPPAEAPAVQTRCDD